MLSFTLNLCSIQIFYLKSHFKSAQGYILAYIFLKSCAYIFIFFTISCACIHIIGAKLVEDLNLYRLACIYLKGQVDGPLGLIS